MKRTRRLTEEERQSAAIEQRVLLRHLARLLLYLIAIVSFVAWATRSVTVGILAALGAGYLAWPLVQGILASRRRVAASEVSLEDVEVTDAIRVGEEDVFCRLSDGRVMFFCCDPEDDPRGPTSRATLTFDAPHKEFSYVEWTGREIQPIAKLREWPDDLEEGVALDLSWDDLLARVAKRT